MDLQSLSDLEEHFKTKAKEYVEKIDTLEQLIIKKRNDGESYGQDVIEVLKLDTVLKALEQLINDPPENEKEELLLYYDVQPVLTQSQRAILLEVGNKIGIVHQEKTATDKQIQEKEKELFEPPVAGNESDWTDNSSVADKETDMDILAVDDDIAQQMENSLEQDKSKGDMSEQSEQKVEDLEMEFVVSGVSSHDRIFRGHSKFVVSLAVNAKQNTLASGSGDDTLNVYDLSQLDSEQGDLSPVNTYKELETVNILKFNYNYEILIAVTDNRINLYDTVKKSKNTIELSQECTSIAAHPAGNLCVATSGYEVALYNLSNGSLYSSFYSDKQSTVVDFAPGGKSIVVGSKGQMRIIHPKTEEVKKIEHGTQFHTEEIVSLDFKNNLVLSGGVEGLMCLSNWETANVLIRSQLHPQSVESVMFSHSFAISGCVDGGVRQFDINSFKLIHTSKFDSAITRMIKLSTNQIAVSTFGGVIAVLDPRSPKTQLRLSTGSTIHELVAFKDYGLLAGCEDGLIKYFDVRKHNKY